MFPNDDGWKRYDRLFRSRTPVSARWDQLNPAFWQVTVYRPSLPPQQPAHAGPASAEGQHSSNPIREQVCFAFNERRCSNPSCRRRHVCRNCHVPDRASIDCPCGGSRPRHDYYGTVLLDKEFRLKQSIYDGAKGDSVWDFEGVQVFPQFSKT